MTSQFTLFTTSYARFQPAMGTPIQASNGKPRWPLKYDLTLACKEVYPPWAIVKAKDISKTDFDAAYCEHLATVGVDKIASRFRALAAAGDDHRLVLLCFEAIEKSEANWCHRTMFGHWWQRTVGDEVRELGPTGPPEPEPVLF